MPDSLLAADEPAAVTVHNQNGASPFLIVADHAGNSMPRVLGRLGVPEPECGCICKTPTTAFCRLQPCSSTSMFPGLSVPLTWRFIFSKLCGSLTTSMIGDGRPIVLEVNSKGCSVTSREAVSLGLIVTELVLNALKHAFRDDTINHL